MSSTMKYGIDVGSGGQSELQQGMAAAKADFNAIGGNAPVPSLPMPPIREPAPHTVQARADIPSSPDPTMAAADAQSPNLPSETDIPAAPQPKLAAAKPGVFGQGFSEIGNGVMRGAAELARGIAFVGGGGLAVKADQLHSAFSGKQEYGAQNAVFGAIDNYANKIVDYFKVGDPEKSGIGAQVLGDAAAIVPALFAGPVGFGALAAGAGTTAAIDAAKAGQDVKTGAMLATVAVAALAGGAALPMKNPAIWKRIGISMLGNTVITAGQQAAAKAIYHFNGFQQAANQIDPLDPRSLISALLIGIGFGLRQHKDIPKADPTKVPTAAPAAPAAPSSDEADLSAMQPGTGPAPPPPGGGEAGAKPALDNAVAPTGSGAPPLTPAGPTSAVSTGALPGAAPVAPTTPAIAPVVPDHPSAESARQLSAQFRDLYDNATPRTGVLIPQGSIAHMAGSPDANAASVKGKLGQATLQGRTIDLPQGTLVLRTKKGAEAAQARLKAGEDPQAVIGSVTGAGSGKSPEKTAVVQGKDPAGNVAVEKMVAPADVPAAVQSVADEGKTPVVTTPEAAVQQRVDDISTERNTPTQEGLVTTDNGKQIPVHVEPGAADGLTRVRLLDQDGEPTAKTMDIPTARVKVSAPDTAAPEVIKPAATETKKPLPYTPNDSGKGQAAAARRAEKTVEPAAAETPKPATPTEPKSPPPAVESAPAEPAKPAPKITVKPSKKLPAKTEGSAPKVESPKVEPSNEHDRTSPADLQTMGNMDAEHAAVEKITSGELTDEDEVKTAHQRLRDVIGAEMPSLKAMFPDGRDEDTDAAPALKKSAGHAIDRKYGNVGRNNKESADIRSRKAREDAEAKRRDENEGPPRDSVPAGTEPPAPKVLKAEKPKTYIEQLRQALETHEALEANGTDPLRPVTDRKNIDDLPTRRENMLNFAMVLAEAPKRLVGKASMSDLERAAKASRVVGGFASATGNTTRGMGTKDSVATKRGQGIGHPEISVVTDEMHRVARMILDEAKPGDEVSLMSPSGDAPFKLAISKAKAKEGRIKAPAVGADGVPLDEHQIKAAKAEALKAKAAAKAEKAAAKKAADEKLIQLVLNPVEGEVVPRGKKEAPVLPNAERDSKSATLLNAYTDAEHGLPAESARLSLEQHLHDAFPEYTPEKRDQVMEFADAQREAQNPVDKGTPRMSDTVEPEKSVLSAKEVMGGGDTGFAQGNKTLLNTAHSMLENIKQKVFGNKMHQQWTKLASKVNLTRMLGKVDSGQGASSHAILDHMLAHAHDPELRAILESLRRNMPDVPVHLVSQVGDLGSGELYDKSVYGAYSPDERTIQVRSTGHDVRQLRTLVHEMFHAATSHEITDHPTGPLALSLERARRVLKARFDARFGAEHAADSRDPNAGGINHWYGLHDTHEMISELYTNPDFAQLVAESEKWVQPDEDRAWSQDFGAREAGVAHVPQIPMARTNHTLLSRIFGRIGEFFGIKDPKLLNHIAGLGEMTMQAQRANNHGLDTPQNVPQNAPRFMQGRAEDKLAAGSVRDLIDHGASMAEAVHAAPGLAKLHEPLQWNPKIAKVTGEHLSRGPPDEQSPISKTVATFARAFTKTGARDAASNAVDGVRKVVARLKAVDQIVRDYRPDFGSVKDQSNPMNRFEDVDHSKTKIMRGFHDITRPVAEHWNRLPEDVSTRMGQLGLDATMWKLDPRKAFAEHSADAQKGYDAANRHAEFVKRFNDLPVSDKTNKDGTPTWDAKKVLSDAFDANRTIAKETRKANIDAALQVFQEGGPILNDAQRRLLYSAKGADDLARMVRPGGLVDVGKHSADLVDALKTFASQTEIQGPFMHLGREGEHVVQATKTGDKVFPSSTKAIAFEHMVNNLSPNSTAKYQLLGGQHTVTYKADYTAFHGSRTEAEADQQRLAATGLESGNVKVKQDVASQAGTTAGMRALMADATRKITQNGTLDTAGTRALIKALHSSYQEAQAARSTYAGSQLARQSVAGVKANEMRKNFADYAQSSAWHIAQMRTLFDQANALAALHSAARESGPGISQATTYRRGEAARVLGEHMLDEATYFGEGSPFNQGLAKLVFLSYLASPSHAVIWSTQNFTTGIPLAGARWGQLAARGAFYRAMWTTISPVMRQGFADAFKRGGNSHDIHEAVRTVLENHPHWGQYVKGENSPYQKLVDQGVLDHGYSDQMMAMANSDAAPVSKVMEFSRLLPNMADAFNRISTALAGLELSKGDVRQTADFVREVHADYSQENKPLYFKQINRVPSANSVTMFMTYRQSMAHLLYSNVKSAIMGSGQLIKGAVTKTATPEGLGDKTWVAAKTVAGMVVGNTLFAGVYAGAMLEPVRLAIYAYHKLFDKEGEAYDLKNAVNKFVEEAAKGAGASQTWARNIAGGIIPRTLGIDLSTRMGLADLFFKDLPDLMSNTGDNWKQFIYNESGTMTSFLAQHITEATQHVQNGEYGKAIGSLVPFKQYQDGVKALQLGTTGKLNSLGSVVAKPSTYNAIVQAAGFRPAEVADAAEYARVSFEYKATVKAVRESILKGLVTGKPNAQARLDNFNRLHPTDAIFPKDIRGIDKLQQKIQQNAPNRDPELNRRENF